jgi:hypothetical protein
MGVTIGAGTNTNINTMGVTIGAGISTNINTMGVTSGAGTANHVLLNWGLGINSCGRSKHSDCSLF